MHINILCRFALIGLLATLPLAPAGQANAETTGSMASAVVRINGKRFKKITAGTSSLYVPSQGLPIDASLPAALCPQALSSQDEVLEISKAVPADDEIKAAATAILQQMNGCKSAAVVKDAPAHVDDGCSGKAIDPKLDGKGEIASGTGNLAIGCRKNFSK